MAVQNALPYGLHRLFIDTQFGVIADHYGSNSGLSVRLKLT